MIGDPLYDAIARRKLIREAQKPMTESSSPEGVAFYACDAIIQDDDYEIDDIPDMYGPLCGYTTEGRPWEPVPTHHGRPMRISGYDWNRELA